MKQNYTKQEVESLIQEIIHRDSFGDVHWAAQKVEDRTGLNLSKPPENKAEE